MPARWLAGAALALAAQAVPVGAAGCELQVRSPGDGALLASVAMGASRSLDLSYLHSVTRTPVRETLTAGPEGLVQRRIEFTEHGPGMPTEALAGERFQLSAGRFVLDRMDRRVGVLRMRVDPAQHQALEAAGRTLSLTQWSARSLILQALECD